MATKKTKPETETTVATDTAAVSREDRMIQLLEAIDWKLWEMMKIAKPEMTDAE